MVAISEICQVFGLGRQNQRLFMTLKTQLKLRLVECRIEFRRIRLGQHPEIVTAMGQVAPAAIILFDGPMEIGIVFDLVNKRRQNLIDRRPDGLVMAGQAESRRRTGQEGFDGRRMGRVTFQTSAFL